MDPNQTRLPFPPITRSHILHCSYHEWHPKYRAVTPKARLIPLSPAFLSYLRADGIVLPPESPPPSAAQWSDSDSGIFSGGDDASETEDDEDPSQEWQDVHQSIKTVIAELDGKVAPKLNWSAPKDATWISATNSMDCRTPNDIYLLLKSSDFVTHDLEHAFDDCVVEDTTQEHSEGKLSALATIPYHLVLRKHIMINPAVEFRCFVRDRVLLGMCQRDLNHFDFLFALKDSLVDRIEDFFAKRLKDSFADANFTFDVYVPPPHERVWLIDINPWAPRTDPLLFSWMELLSMPSPESNLQTNDFIRLSLNETVPAPLEDSGSIGSVDNESVSDAESDDTELIPQRPELRLIRRDDPEAYSFATPQYSAHKLPRDVVDATTHGPGPMREFADQWKDALARRQQQQKDENDSAED